MFFNICRVYINHLGGNEYFKMRFFIIFLTQNVLHAFNENLTAVHYSIVNAGIDEEIMAGKVGLAIDVNYSNSFEDTPLI